MKKILFVLALSLWPICVTAQGRISVTAHAGSCSTPPNSIESLQKALSLDVDCIEIDVRRDAAGTLVISHNAVKPGEDAVLLKDALSVIRPGRSMINLDIKDSSVFPMLYRLLKRMRMLDRVFMTGVAPEDILKARLQMPGVPYYPSFEPSVELVSNPEYVRAMVSFLKATGSEGINCNYKSVTPELASVLKANGLKLSVWTVDSEREMLRIISVCPDNITSRHPDRVRELVGE